MQSLLKPYQSRFSSGIKSVVRHILGTIIPLLFLSTVTAQPTNPCFLQRSINLNSLGNNKSTIDDIRYEPLFGIGDADADRVQGINRFGLLSMAPGAVSQHKNYGREELIYFVLRGSGVLSYGTDNVSIAQGDYFYIPINTGHGLNAGAQESLHLIVMGYPVPYDTKVESSTVQIANVNEVEFQTLEQLNHGATSRFQLLLGTTQSKRDRLSAAIQVNSLFVIDFDPGGTNIPHKHEKEEEVYLVLQGSGEMVAGETAEGKPNRIPTKAGDVFFYSRNCQVGFYSGTKEGEPHARILAVRSKYPGGN